MTNTPYDIEVLTEEEAAAYVRLSPRTLQRLRLEGDGPPYIQLSAHRIAYTKGDINEWLSSRRRGSTSPVIVTGKRRV